MLVVGNCSDNCHLILTAFKCCKVAGQKTDIQPDSRISGSLAGDLHGCRFISRSIVGRIDDFIKLASGTGCL